MAEDNFGSKKQRKISLYGCSVVAPGAANLKEFLSEIREQTFALERDAEFGNLFFVGRPKFNFEVYKEWISSRHNPARYSQLADKGGQNVKYAIGSAIDALEQTPGLEAALKKLDTRVLTCYGSGFGDLESNFKGQAEYLRASEMWNHFWSRPSKNTALKNHLSKESIDASAPPHPSLFEEDSIERTEARIAWDKFWAPKSEALQSYLKDFADIEKLKIGADVATDKLHVIRTKAKGKKQLQEKYGCPVAPWDSVNPNFLWNLPNANAAQVTMLLGLHGVSFASIGACATFGLVLRHALDGIQSGNYDAAIIGTTDVSPPPVKIAAFNAAKVLAAGESEGIPLCNMRGTHVSGGACTWIIAADDVMAKLDVKSLGVEILSVGMSSDAEHIITPSLEGPKHCIREAFAMARVQPKDIVSWDMHATGTPGDWSEFKLMEEFVPNDAVISARKGIFGHGMATCGGWELTAQVMGFSKTADGRSQVLPSGIPSADIHPSIVMLNRKIASDKAMVVPQKENGIVCGKLSMGIGGISTCVLTKVTV